MEFDQTQRYDRNVFKKLGDFVQTIFKNTLSDKTKNRLLSAKYRSFVMFEIIFCRFFTFLGKNLVLSYNANQKIDGTGAQLQRILSIYALSCRYKMGFKNSQIESVAIHPLDNINSDRELTSYLSEMNELFELPEKETNATNKMDAFIISLQFRNFAFAALKSYFLRKQITLHVVTPYGVSDYHPDSYRSLTNDFFHWKNGIDTWQVNSKKRISVHYRSGVGGMAIQKGEKFPREIRIDYFINIVDSIIHSLDKEVDFEILIFTDAPSRDMQYIPPSNQTQLWSTSPGFAAGIMNVKGNDLASGLEKYGHRCSIRIGGNPLTAIEFMSKSDYLIMGRSSLSYVAAILNKEGVIYYPPRFWHPPMSHWKISPSNSF